MFQQSPEQAINYLAAKKPIDDRSLNSHVWSVLWQNAPEAPLQILELGAGIGTMIERILEQGKLTAASYTAIDLDPAVIGQARGRLLKWAAANQLGVLGSNDPLTIDGDGLELALRFLSGDITVDLKTQVGADWDLLIGNALLDLIDIPTNLPELLALIKPAGLFYFTITFDGITHFEPVIDRDLDQAVIQHYHRTMDERKREGKPAGNSLSGRRLLGELHRLGAEILAAGSSDWIIHPRQGSYPDEEASFLAAILSTIENALTQQAELPQEDIDLWIRTRRQQLADADLIYLAHQLDVCGHPPAHARQE